MEKIKNRGISLIVLVITILVLAILATIVIISLSNTNIIEQAQDAVNQNNLQSMKEAVNLEVIAHIAENQGRLDIDTLVDRLNNAFNSEGYSVTKSESPDKIIVSNENIVIEVSDAGIVTGSIKGENIPAQNLPKASPDEWFMNCTIPTIDNYYGELQMPGNACFDTDTGILYSVALPNGVTEVVIPEKINGVTVKEISGENVGSVYENISYMPSTLTKVTINHPITLSNGAFYGNSGGFNSKISFACNQFLEIQTKVVETDDKVKIKSGSVFQYDGWSFTNFEFEPNGTFEFGSYSDVPLNFFTEDGICTIPSNIKISSMANVTNHLQNNLYIICEDSETADAVKGSLEYNGYTGQDEAPYVKYTSDDGEMIVYVR